MEIIKIQYAWALLFIWQFLAAPFILIYVKDKLLDGGWAFGRITSWLSIGLVVWFLAHFSLPVNTAWFVWLLTAVASYFSFKFFQNNKEEVLKQVKKKLPFIIAEEVIFFLAFLFLGVVRMMNPDILSLEKFMDGGLILSYMKSPSLPIEDMWLAGESFNYYTFGHFLGSIISFFWGFQMSISYNIILAYLYGLVLMQSFSLGLTLASSFFSLSPVPQKGSSKKLPPVKNYVKLMVSGLTSAFFVGVGGNSQAIWYYLKKGRELSEKTGEFFLGSMKDYWYPDATRFIDRTIHEFPIYSFIVCDLHAHVWSLPITLFLYANVYLWLRELILNLDYIIKSTSGTVYGLVSWLKQALGLTGGADDHTKDHKKSQKSSKRTKKTVENVPLSKFFEIFYQQPYFYHSFVVGVLIGICFMTSSWDMMIYGLMLIVIGAILMLVNVLYFFPLLISALVVVVMTFATSSLWWLNFENISEGFKWVEPGQRSPFWKLAVLWGGHVTMSLLTLGLVFKTFFSNFKKILEKMKVKGKKIITLVKNAQLIKLIMVSASILSAFILLALPEYIYLADIYDGHPRANTMFKFTFQAFTLMGLSLSWLAGFLQSKKIKKVWLRLPLIVLFSVFVVVVGIYPYFGFRDNYGFMKWNFEDEKFVLQPTFKGLDGMHWLQEKYPSDYRGIQWLRKNVEGRPVIIEAVGESYTEYARVSTFTGMPAVLGWPVHEWLWRGSNKESNKRQADVAKVYQNPKSSTAKTVLNQYQVDYIFLGQLENEKYGTLSIDDFSHLGEIVFQDDGTYIIER